MLESRVSGLQYCWSIKIFTCGSTASLKLVRVVVVVLVGTILKFLHFLPLEGARGNIR